MHDCPFKAADHEKGIGEPLLISQIIPSGRVFLVPNKETSLWISKQSIPTVFYAIIKLQITCWIKILCVKETVNQLYVLNQIISTFHCKRYFCFYLQPVLVFKNIGICITKPVAVKYHYFIVMIDLFNRYRYLSISVSFTVL